MNQDIESSHINRVSIIIMKEIISNMMDKYFFYKPDQKVDKIVMISILKQR